MKRVLLVVTLIASSAARAQVAPVLPWDPPQAPATPPAVPPPDVRARLQLALRGGMGLGLTHAPKETYFGLAAAWTTRALADRLGVELEVGRGSGSTDGSALLITSPTDTQILDLATSRDRWLALAGPVLRFDGPNAAATLSAGPLLELLDERVALGNPAAVSTSHQRRLGAFARGGVELDGLVGPGSITFDVRALLPFEALPQGGTQVPVTLQGLAGYRLWFR